MKETESKFKYPHVDKNGRKVFVRTAIEFFNKDLPKHILMVNYVPDGKWVQVNVEVGGYNYLDGLQPFYDSQEECKAACDSHNRYWGWNQQQAFEIEAMSFGVLEWPNNTVNINNVSQ